MVHVNGRAMASSTKRSLIILGILGLVVLALFAVSVVFESGGRGGSGCSSRKLDAWRDRLFDPEPVERGQLAGCPIAPGRIVSVTIPGRCALRIAPADARLRRLVVQAVQPVELERTTDADGRRITMRADLDAGEREELFVQRGGETLGLRCRAGATCRAVLR
jgi:hypothetical protein